MAQVTFEGYRSPYAAAHPQGQRPQPNGYAQAGHPGYAPAGQPWPGAARSAPPQTDYAHPDYADEYGYAQPAPQGHPAAGYGGRAVPASAAGVGMARLVNLTGAVLSVAMLLGVGVWSYRLMVRDVTGVPVIQALEGPIRRSPEEPGGRQTPYQELSVNTVAARGEAAGAAQVIAVAPPPVELSDEDRAIAEMAGAAQPAAPAAPITAPITAPATPATLTPLPQPVPPAPAGGPGAASQPLTLVPASAPGVSASPVPRRRPGAGTRVAAATAPADGPGAVDAQAEAVLQELVTRLSPADATEIDPTALAPGTRLVQLSVYESIDEARAAWDQLADRFPAYLDGRGRIVDSATAGGRTFYRLRAHGFVDEPEARRFCSVFLAQGVDCIPVLTGR